MMIQSIQNTKIAPRKLSREVRRQQFIEATIDLLADRGYARTTLTDVARRAGLSHGLVNFHFKTKELLLSETLSYLSNEYRENWQSALEAVPTNASMQLDALIKADFVPRICETRKLAAWCAFWGEAQSRPMYQAKCGTNDDEYVLMLESICTNLLTEGGYSGIPERIARVIRCTVEGVWMDLATQTRPYSREEAMGTAYASLTAFFPKHFDQSGLLIKNMLNENRL